MFFMVYFKENYNLSRFQRGPTFSRGSKFFQAGGGSSCLFPIETYVTCDFPGVGRTPLPSPTPGSAHVLLFDNSSRQGKYCCISFFLIETFFL